MTEMYPMNIEEMEACADWFSVPCADWFSVHLENSFTVIIRNWLEENIKGYWWHTGSSIIFEHEEDAMAFKLRWL